ncbi:MAG TPA: hypothetical protein VJ673_21790 [Aromatoleum sp.]|uniref:hypothetical protein n=1 Tax=Aromatoleum sp. TaxID=2307007 RepID=UPI002B48AB53|nr:hypothetical protein [Aromatoleum sp.]HJV28324.1 hypothetical protein [Aromatoleum sp.]
MATPSFLSPSLLAALALRPALTLLPRVPVDIRLHEPEKRPDDPRRLNLFAGRALGEREFERLQAYVDDRVAPLLASLEPGIVEGLPCAFFGTGADTRVRVQPGLAVGAAGQLIRLFYPLDQAWTDLAAQAERDQDTPLRDGLFLVTIRSAVEPIDDPTDQEPCTRTEPDPLRERRIETVSLLGLQRIAGSPRLMAMPQPQAANRIGARLLRESPFRADSGAVPLGLVKVVGKLPVWFDPLAGRLLAEPGAAAHTLLAQTVAALEAWQRDHPAPLPNVPTQTLAELLGLDYLPAAGPLPAALLRDPAGKTPTLAFLPADLQVELAPVPASTVEGVVADELSRGSVDLIHGLGERIRLLLAIPDLDYRRDLFDLPQRDTQLEDELFRRGEAAARAFQAWKQQWFALFHGLTPEQLKALRAPMLRAIAPRDPDLYRDDLVTARRATLAPATGPIFTTAAVALPTAPLPEPYASHVADRHPPPPGYSPVEDSQPGDPGLFRQREDLREDIRHLEAALDQSFRLLEEVNDFLGLQRQQLDTLTVSLSTLAGGVPGDGLGAKLVRWTTKAQFVPKVATTPEEPR